MALNQASLERLWAHIIARLGRKVDKEDGKGLSSCDFTKQEKEKLANLETNVQADWNDVNPENGSYIVNKPTELVYKEFCTWDGNNDGKDLYPGYYPYAKISDRTDFTLEQLIGARVTQIYTRKQQNHSETSTMVLTEDDLYIRGNGAILDFYGVIFVTEDCEDEDGYLWPAGIYGMYVDSTSVKNYISRVEFRVPVIREDAISSEIARVSQLPCGYKSGIIEWDGNTDGRAFIQVGDMTYYKVSDYFPNPNELIGKNVDLLGMVATIDESMIDDGVLSSNGWYRVFFEGTPILMIFKEENYIESYDTSFEKGIYFLYFNETTYISSLKLDDYIVQIDPQFIPDTIARVGESGSTESYVLPVATSDTLGGVKAVAKTDSMTQEIGVDEEGKLWGEPGANEYTLPVATATVLGGVKPVAATSDMTQDVGVTSDGKLKAPAVAAPTNEQIKTSLESYLSENPVPTTPNDVWVNLGRITIEDGEEVKSFVWPLAGKIKKFAAKGVVYTHASTGNKQFLPGCDTSGNCLLFGSGFSWPAGDGTQAYYMDVYAEKIKTFATNSGVAWIGVGGMNTFSSQHGSFIGPHSAQNQDPSTQICFHEYWGSVVIPVGSWCEMMVVYE